MGKYKQLGNSVSIPVIKTMAEFMLTCFAILEEQQAEVVRALAENNEFFTKRDVMDLLDLNASQAGSLLKKMIDSHELLRISRGSSTRYVRNDPSIQLSPYSQAEKVLKLADENQVFTNQDVQAFLQINADCTNVLLSGMQKKGLITRLKRGIYAKARQS